MKLEVGKVAHVGFAEFGETPALLDYAELLVFQQDTGIKIYSVDIMKNVSQGIFVQGKILISC